MSAKQHARGAARIAVILLALLAAGWAKKPKSAADQNTAISLVQMLSSGNYQGVVLHFNKDLKKQESPEKLKALWAAVLNEYGSFKKQVGLDAENVPGYDIINVHCAFQYAPVIVRFVFTGHNRVGNLFIVPDTPKKPDNT